MINDGDGLATVNDFDTPGLRLGQVEIALTDALKKTQRLVFHSVE
jgi:hypothetical protein